MAVFAGDTVRVQFRGRCFQQQIMLDLSYRVTVGNAGITTAATLAELNNVIGGGGAATPRTLYLKCLPPQYTLEEIRSQVVKPVRSAYQNIGFVGIVGTHAGAATVSCDSAAIVRRTELSGRRQVSTLKIGPCPDSASAAGLLTDAYRGLLEEFAQSTIFSVLLPVSTVQLIPTILTVAGDHDQRDLTSHRVGRESRIMRRRVVGIGS